MARTCSGSSASFWIGGRPWVRRTPASTVATWRSLRSKGSDLWAKSGPAPRAGARSCRRSGACRQRLERRRRAPRDRGRRIRGRRGVSGRGPGGRASADSRANRRRRRGWCFWRSPRGRRPGRSRTAARVLQGGEPRPGVLPLAAQGARPGHGRDPLRLAARLMAGRRRSTGSTPKAGLSPCRRRRRQVASLEKLRSSDADHLASQGFNVEARVSSKSATLRVTTIRSWTIAVAAISPSASPRGRSAAIRPHSMAMTSVIGRIRSA